MAGKKSITEKVNGKSEKKKTLSSVLGSVHYFDRVDRNIELVTQFKLRNHV
jgi:hypothetical protein